jgi:hypothetical protein
MRYISLILLSMALGHASFCQPGALTVHPSPTRHGSEHGSLLIIGGNVGSTASIWDKFTELAGGKEKAHLVVVTAAIGDSAGFDQKDVDTVRKYTGVKDVVLLHTSDLRTANSEQFGWRFHSGIISLAGRHQGTVIASGPFFFLSEGQKYDLKARKPIRTRASGGDEEED